MQAWVQSAMPVQRRLLGEHKAGMHGGKFSVGDPGCASCLFRKAKWPEEAPQPPAVNWTMVRNVYALVVFLIVLAVWWYWR